jgi:hypothetical protein
LSHKSCQYQNPWAEWSQNTWQGWRALAISQPTVSQRTHQADTQEWSLNNHWSFFLLGEVRAKVN